MGFSIDIKKEEIIDLIKDELITVLQEDFYEHLQNNYNGIADKFYSKLSKHIIMVIDKDEELMDSIINKLVEYLIEQEGDFNIKNINKNIEKKLLEKLITKYDITISKRNEV